MQVELTAIPNSTGEAPSPTLNLDSPSQQRVHTRDQGSHVRMVEVMQTAWPISTFALLLQDLIDNYNDEISIPSVIVDSVGFCTMFVD